MGFFGEVLGSVVKVALTPVAVVKDVVNVATGDEPTATTELIDDAVDGVGKAVEDLADGDL